MQLGRARGTCWSRPDGHARVSHGDQFNKKGLLIVRLNFDFFFFFFFCYAGSFLSRGLCSGFGEWVLLPSCVEQASRCSGFSCRAQALGCVGFGSCHTWTRSLHFLGSGTWAQLLWCSGLLGAPRNVGSSQTRDQTSKPCLLYWQLDSSPLSHQGRP